MTALELADWLDKKAIVSLTDYFSRHLKNSAIMLRQQEAEIEALKVLLNDRESAIYATGYWNGIAKVKPRELTDEEIIQINKDEGTCWDVPDRFAILIARAILKKASDK
jgi:hypothetical protein